MSFDSIPSEVLEQIFNFLDPFTAFICEKVCVRWRHVLVLYWMRKVSYIGRNVHKFSLEAFGHSMRGQDGDEQYFSEIKRILILERSLQNIHQCQLSKKEYQFNLSKVGWPSIGGRHVCGQYLLVLNLMINGHSGEAAASQSHTSTNDSTINTQTALQETSPDYSDNNYSGPSATGTLKPKTRKNAFWQLNIYHIPKGKLLKSIANINLCQPVIAGCCFDGTNANNFYANNVAISPSNTASHTGNSATTSATNNGLLSNILKMKSTLRNSDKDESATNEKISAIVLFERERVTTDSKVIVVKAPFRNSHQHHSSVYHHSTAAASGTSSVNCSDHQFNEPNNGEPNSNNRQLSAGVSEFYFSTEFKQSQSTIRVFDHLLVVTFRHEERTETELQIHHVLDHGSRIEEWKRWIVPEQVWRVEFKDENVFALACRTKVLFFNVLNGSYQTIFSCTHIPKTRLFIGMKHVMFASDYGSKPAVVLPIADTDYVGCSNGNRLRVNVNSSESLKCGGKQSGGGGGGSENNSEAVLIDSIKWRDLSFKSASIGSTVLVDSPDENQFTIMNLDNPTVKLQVSHPNIDTKECELCGLSIVGHELFVVLRNLKQNYCHVVKFDLLTAFVV